MTSRATGLPANLPDAARAYVDAMPAGEVVVFPIGSTDRIGLPVWIAAFFADDPRLDDIMPYGAGYGETDAQAILGALGEMAEMALPEMSSVLGRPVRGASWTDLVRVHGEAHVADPLTLCLPAGSAVGRDSKLDWVEARRARDDAVVLVPIELAAASTKPLAAGYEPFTTVITNGMGCGPDVPFALSHGLFELLQRDGNGLLFRALDQGVLIDLGNDPPPALASLALRFANAGIELMPKFATDEWGFCNVYCVGRDRDPPLPIMLTACGEGCHPDRTRAVVKAMTEFAASRARKAIAHGPQSFVDRFVPADFTRRFMRHAGRNAKTGESRAYRAMLDWTRRDASVLAGWLADSVHAVRAHRAFDGLPEHPGLDPREAGRLATERLRAGGLEPLYVDHSPPGGAVACVKAIVPGLEVETMSYHRIGERNTAKLLARDHPLIRFGQETDTLRPVRLTPAALERFGAQPLFDTALADRIVGSLYPLYREPEAHHVASAAMHEAA